MQAAVGPPDPATIEASAHGAIPRSVLLERVAAELDAVAALIVQVEGALAEVVVQAGSVSPALLSRLQQIDFALQSIQDVSRVLMHAADPAKGSVLDKTEIAKLIRLGEINRRVLMPDTSPETATGEDVCWF